MKYIFTQANTPTAFLRPLFFLYNVQEYKFFKIDPS